MRGFTVSKIVVHPTNSQVCVGLDRPGRIWPGGGVFRSNNGGIDWAPEFAASANWDDMLVCGRGRLGSRTQRNDKDPDGGQAGETGAAVRSSIGE